MTESRKTVAIVVSMTLILVLGALVWMAMPRQEKVIELPPVHQGVQR